MREQKTQHPDKVPGLQPWTLAMRDALISGRMRSLQTMTITDCTLEVLQDEDSLWLLIQRAGRGGLALRAGYSFGGSITVEPVPQKDAEIMHEWRIVCAVGEFRVQVSIPDPAKPLLRCTVRLTPAEPLLIPFWPRDLFPIDDNRDPIHTKGNVHAAQRGLNAGIVYLTLDQPRFGSLLYFQNLTALNGYFNATETTPDGRVGGLWPELGYQPPTGSQPLPKGKEIVLSDAFLHWSDEMPHDPRQVSRLFLDLLAGVYRQMERPVTRYHDWPGRARETLHDLEHSPMATVRQYGHVYLQPYTDAEYPDSMVQLTTLMPIREFAVWSRRDIPFAGELRAGVKRFFDPELGTTRRYLPDVGKGKKANKDPNEVDSWYLYHPLINLGRLALEGDQEAREQFLGSLDHGIKVAHHFHYLWPVQFKVDTLEIITGVRKPGDPGQSDTGGLYSYVMLQAHQLTGERRFLEEAKKAALASKDLTFDLEYQANITAWGANACIRLWKETGETFYLDQSYVFLAGFFHNSLLWESKIANAKHYTTFLGATCLHDGPYMALYECFESFAAFHEYLLWGADDLPDSVRLLMSEYCKYALSRAWYYYPKELPEEALAQESRNGHIDRKLAFPVEDLYGDGQPAGQIGQEIYGSGAAFAFTTRAYHRLKKAPFELYCEYPIFELEETDESCFSFRVRGAEGVSCRARLLPIGQHAVPTVTIRDDARSGATRHGHKTDEGHCEFEVSGASRIEVRWDAKDDKR